VTQAKSTCLTLLALTFTSALGCERDPSTAPPDLVVTSDLEKFKAPVCNLDGVDCYCVPGGTLAAAHWTFRGIVPTKFPEGLCCTLDCRVARIPYGDLTAETSFSGTVAVWNPSTKLKSAPFPFTLRSQVSASTEFRIPARVKVVGSDGSLTEVGLFEKLVDKGEVHLEVQCAQLDTMLAFTANDLRVSPSKVERDEREKTAVSPKPDLQGMETDSYGRAMTACRLAWRRYESGIREIDYGGRQLRIVPLAHELAVKDELEVVLRTCRDELQLAGQAEHKTETLRRVVAVNFLLQAEERAWQLLEQAASEDESLRGLIEYHRGKQHWDRSEIAPAYRRLQDALRLDPDNDYAVALLAKAAGKMDQPLSADITAKANRIAALRKQGQPRTLPWLTVLPVEASLQGLTRTVVGPTVATLP
jgi:hypothetical protein